MMYRYFLAAAVVFALGPGGLIAGAAPAKKSSKSVTKASSSKTRGRSRRSVARKRGPSYQTHPTEDRYKEIQQALADKGFFKGEVNGQWGQDSVDALKDFQTRNNLINDGKIGSRSLIALGLGPKHDGTTAQTVPASGAPQTPPVSQSAPATAPAETNPTPQQQ